MSQEIFVDAPITLSSQLLLDSLIEVRRDLFLDPLLSEAWSCDPDRCRARMGPNLCCKVQKRCRHLVAERCNVHDDKPFSCLLFPLDLVRFGGNRVVTTVKNVDFFHTGWCRYDRDMLRCFEGIDRGGRSMFEAQRAVLARVFTRSELTLLEEALAESRRGGERREGA